MEGYFGPTASQDRSFGMEQKAQETVVPDIQQRIQGIRAGMKQHPETVAQTRDVELQRLKTEWRRIPKGGKEELAWVEEAIALTGAHFEEYQEHNKKPGFELRENQLYYMTLLLLGKGKYDFGELLTKNRGVQLPTGEGKTYGFGLVAAVLALRGEQVHVVEPNYNSALDHAKRMGGFYEDFMGIQTGVQTDMAGTDEWQSKLTVRPNGEVIPVPVWGGVRRSFQYRDGKLVPEHGHEGRRKVWQNRIVYADSNSIGFDYLEDRTIGQKPENRLGQPDLRRCTALIAEADGVILDDARNPWIMSEALRGGEAWDAVAGLLDLDRKRLKRTPEERRKGTQKLLFNLWLNLSRADHEGYFVPGKDQDYYYANRQLVLSERIENKAKSIAREALSGLPEFGSEEKVESALRRNEFVIDTALKVLLGLQGQRDYLTGRQPVLMDEYGFPLDKRQLTNMHQVFLQMQNMWQGIRVDDWIDRMITEGRPSFEILDALWKRFQAEAEKMEVSGTTARTFATKVYGKYGSLRASSGSLVPAAKTFEEVYGMETLGVSRHLEIEDPETMEDGPHLRCLDGGLAKVAFMEREKRITTIVDRVQALRDAGRMGLIIMPDVASAQELAKSIPGAVVVTGKEEYAKRGSLDQAVGHGEKGKIIITTWMAHRDIDLDIPDDVKVTGGPECIVCGLLPTERGFWQAIQRTVRGDVPGSRLLLVTDEDIEPIAQADLFTGGQRTFLLSNPQKSHEQHVERISQMWNQVLSGEEAGERGILQAYLSYLRGQEETMKKQLLYQAVKDDRIEDWQGILLTRAEARLREPKMNGEPTRLQHAIDVEVERRLRTLVPIEIKTARPGDRVPPDEHKRTEALLKKLQEFTAPPIVTIRQDLDAIAITETRQILRHEIEEDYKKAVWEEFLVDIDAQFNSFLFDPRVSQLTIEQLRNRWDVFMLDYVKKRRFSVFSDVEPEKPVAQHVILP